MLVSTTKVHKRFSGKVIISWQNIHPCPLTLSVGAGARHRMSCYWSTVALAVLWLVATGHVTWILGPDWSIPGPSKVTVKDSDRSREWRVSWPGPGALQTSWQQTLEYQRREEKGDVDERVGCESKNKDGDELLVLPGILIYHLSTIVLWL